LYQQMLKTYGLDDPPAAAALELHPEPLSVQPPVQPVLPNVSCHGIGIVVVIVTVIVIVIVVIVIVVSPSGGSGPAAGTASLSTSILAASASAARRSALFLGITASWQTVQPQF
jgi:hypothetical protein